MVKTGCVKTNGFETDYCRFGTGSKPFVIVPGISIQSVMSAKDMVANSYVVFKDDFTVYLFDRRKVVPNPYSIYDMADDTAAVFKELGLTDAYLFGASQGGMVTMVLAARYPRLVKKAILGSTSAHITDAMFQKTLAVWISLAKRQDSAALYDAFGRSIYPPDVYMQFKDIFASVSKTVTNEELEKFIILAESLRDFDCRDELEKIHCPVLALGSNDDEMFGSDPTKEIAKKLGKRSDFSMHLYDGYGHAAFDTAPDYRQRMYDFCMA